MSHYKAEKQFIMETLAEAGQLLMDNLGKENEPIWATTTNFKVAMDEACDKFIRGKIRQRFPKYSIHSEEDRPELKEGDFSFSVDPIDGTIPYTTHSSPNWSICLALIEGRRPVVGGVFMPQRKELYVGVDGEPSTCNGIEVRVSEETDLSKVLMGSDAGKEVPDWFRRESSLPFKRLDYLITVPFSFGCASVPLCQVSSGKPNSKLPLVGRMNAYLALSLEPWDMAAQVPIIRGAGGKVTHLSGKEWQFSGYMQGDPSILTANPILHQRILLELKPEIENFYREYPKYN